MLARRSKWQIAAVERHPGTAVPTKHRRRSMASPILVSSDMPHTESGPRINLLRWIFRIAAAAAGCAILYAAWAQASLQLLHRFRFPYRDYIFVTEALDKVPGLSALAPWKGPSISEHRVIYPNIFYISDFLYFGANGNLLYLSIFAFTALSAMMLIAPVAAQLGTRSSNAPGIAVVFLFAACAVYWFFSAFNWV